MSNQDLEQSIVIGGASGIGEAVVMELAEKGHRVIVGDTNRDRGEALAKEFPNVYYHYVDVTKPETLQDLASTIKREYENYVTHLVVTAGGAHPEETRLGKNNSQNVVFDIPDDVIRDTALLNLCGSELCVKYIGRLMWNSAQEHRTIWLTSSVNSTGRFGQPVYTASKAGIEGYVRAATAILGPHGIRINAIVPGSTQTPATEREGMNFGAVDSSTPLRTHNTPKDIADAVTRMMYVGTFTGQSLVVDMGQSVQPDMGRYR